MPNDPYAQYLTPPSSSSDGEDPYAKYLAAPPAQEQHGALYNALFKEGSGGSITSSADEGVLPALRDYGLAGLDDITLGAARAHLPTSVGNMIAQAHSNLGPMDPILGAAAYTAGPGKLLGPAGRALGGSGVAGTMAEGMLAGGANAAVGSQDPSLSGIAAGAGQGAALGAAAGLAGKGLQKLVATPGSVDPAVAEAATFADKQAKYGELKNYVFANDPVYNAQVSATLSPGLVPSVSPGFEKLLERQQKQFAGGPVNADDIVHYMQSIDEAARNGSNADKLLAGQITDNLQDILDNSPTLSGHAPGEAGQALKDANAANTQWNMAKNLAEYQRKATANVPLGQTPFTEAETYYKPGSPEYKALINLYQAGQDHGPGSWGIGHLAAGALGDIGGMVLGFPGHMIGEGLAYLGLKPAIAKAMKGVQQGKLGRAIQQSYPTLTGQPLTGAQPGPPVGEMLKNLAIGGMY
jgi:hypothetical protein